MTRRMRMAILGGMLALMAVLGSAETAQAQNYNISNMFYYPYYYYPHSYWPIMSPSYPERVGEPYRKPPAYMAYPAFHEPHWRYDLWERKSYYRGFHFWLDQF